MADTFYNTSYSTTEGIVSLQDDTTYYVQVGNLLDYILGNVGEGGKGWSSFTEYQFYTRFDTSSLPDDATITDVSLRFNVKGLVGQPPLSVHSGTQGDTLTTDDWTAFNATVLTNWDPSQLGTNTISLPTSCVSKTGYTYLVIKPRDLTDHYCTISTQQDSTVANRPALIVSYSSHQESTKTGEWLAQYHNTDTKTGEWFGYYQKESTLTGQWYGSFSQELSGSWYAATHRDSTLTGQWHAALTRSSELTGEWYAERSLTATGQWSAANHKDSVLTGQWAARGHATGELSGEWAAVKHFTHTVTGQWAALIRLTSTLTGQWLAAQLLNPPVIASAVYNENSNETVVTWSDPNTEEVGHRLQKSIDNGQTWTLVDSYSANVTSGTDSNPALGPTFYRVIALGSGNIGDSNPSATFACTPSLSIPSLEASLDLDTGVVTFTPSGSASGCTYVFYRDGVLLPGSTDQLSLPGVYSYTTAAVKGNQISPQSPDDSVTAIGVPSPTFAIDETYIEQGAFIITSATPFTLFRDGVQITSNKLSFIDFPPTGGTINYQVAASNGNHFGSVKSAPALMSLTYAGTIYYLTKEDPASGMTTDLIDQFNTLVGGYQAICSDGEINLVLRRNNDVIATATPITVTESGNYPMPLSVPLVAVGPAQSFYVDIYGDGYPVHTFRLISANLTYLPSIWFFRLFVKLEDGVYYLGYGQSGDYESAMRGVSVSSVPLPLPPTLTYTSNLVTGFATLKASYDPIASGYRFYQDDILLSDQASTQLIISLIQGTHTYKVSAYNTVGESEKSSPSVITLEPPAAPTILKGTYNFSTGEIVLTASVSGVIEGVRFYRNGSLIADVDATTLSFKDTITSSPGTYLYTAKTYHFGGESVASNTETLILTNPAAPTISLAPLNVQTGAVVITATPGDSDTIGYKFYRNGVLLASQPGAVYTDTLSVAGTFIYTAKAYNVVGDSIDSDSKSVIATPPTDLQVLAAFDSRVGGVVITATAGDTATYTYYRNGSTLATVAAGIYTDHVEIAGLYSYSVSATNRFGTTVGNTINVDVLWVGKLKAFYKGNELKFGVKSFALEALDLNTVQSVEFICSEFGRTSEPLSLSFYPPFEGSSDGTTWSSNPTLGYIDSLTMVPLYIRQTDYPALGTEQPLPLADTSYGTVVYSADIDQVTNVVATPGMNKIDLTWDSARNAHFYKIEYRIGTASWAEIPTVLTTFYTLSGLVDGTTYEIRIRGVNEATAGAWSVSVTATTPQVVRREASVSGQWVTENVPVETWVNVYNTGFESDTVDAVPAGWIAGVGFVVKAVGLNSSSKSFGTSTVGISTYYQLPTPITTNMRYSYTVKTGTLGTGRWGTFWFGGTTADAGIAGVNKQATGVAIIGGNFQAAYNVAGTFAWRTLFAVASNTEYTVTIQVDLALKAWWVTVATNGVNPVTYGGASGFPLGSNNPAGNTFSALTHFNVSSQALNAGGTMYFDDVSIDRYQG